MKVYDKSPDAVAALFVLFLATTVAGVATNGFAKLFEYNQKAEEVRRSRDDKVGKLLQNTGHNDSLIKLSELSNTQLGVTPTRYTRKSSDPYVARPSVDMSLDNLLRITGERHPFIVLHGHAKAGKSRTLAEAVRRAQPDAKILLPATAADLKDIVQLDPDPFSSDAEVIVWLDNISTADLDQLTNGLIARITNHASIIASMTTQNYSSAISGPSAIGRTAIELATVLLLPFELSEQERHTAASLYPRECGGKRRDPGSMSIGEVLVGGEELVARYRAGRAECPAGYAVVMAAIDCRRAGFTRPLSDDDLRTLFSLYAPRVHAGIPLTEETFKSALDWATKPVASQVALLQSRRRGWWTVLEYVVAAEDSAREAKRPVPDFLWEELLRSVEAFEAMSLGTSAYLRNFRSVAIEALKIALHDDGMRPAAAFRLGVVLEESGHAADAIEVFRFGVELNDTEYSPRCTIHLGLLLEESGDWKGARSAYEHGINARQPELSDSAATNLELLGSLEEARTTPRIRLQVAHDNGPEEQRTRKRPGIDWHDVTPARHRDGS